jgi:hypothetical protein
MSGRWLLAKQKFKFRPSSCLVLGGILFSVVRLWKVRFLGCDCGFVEPFCSVWLKLYCIVQRGLA